MYGIDIDWSELSNMSSYSCTGPGWSIWDDRLEKLFYAPISEVNSSAPFRVSSTGEVIGSSFFSEFDQQLSSTGSVNSNVYPFVPTAPAPMAPTSSYRSGYSLNVSAAPFIPVTRVAIAIPPDPSSSGPVFHRSGIPNLRPILGRPQEQSNQPDPPGSPGPCRPLRRSRPSDSSSPSYPGPPEADPSPWFCSYCKRKEKKSCHKDIDWVTGQYRCRVLKKAVIEIAEKKNLRRRCEYCSKAAPDQSRTHWMKCPITKKVTCPVLRSLPKCPNCGVFGDYIHTTNRCPERPDLGFAQVVKRALV